MKAGLLRICLIFAICINLAIFVVPQTRKRSQSKPPQEEPLLLPEAKPTPTPRIKSTRQPVVHQTVKPTPAPPSTPTPVATPEPTAEPSPSAEEEPEVVKVSTNLVTVPLIAATVEGMYIPDLKQEELAIAEDGVQQNIAFFTTVNAPFHVVLLLDTSASTQEKLGMIRKAANSFVEQLQPADKVKVISFDDNVRDLNDFTSNRAELRNAINKTESGQGTKVYDAIELALSSIRSIRGRKAIVLFSDGMDWHSDASTFDSTLRWLDESEVIVYPIRFETRAETERLAREQAREQGSTLPTLGTIRSIPPGTTAPTFPSDDPHTVPTAGYPGKNGPLGLPLPGEIARRKREAEKDRDRDRRPDPRDDSRSPAPTNLPGPDTSDPGDSSRDTRMPRRGTRPSDADSISGMLDRAYAIADSYLLELATRSGGRIVRADTLSSLPNAFGQIAAELRTQYAIGYYPTNKEHNGQYRKIKITTTRKNLHVRARPGYRAPTAG